MKKLLVVLIILSSVTFAQKTVTPSWIRANFVDKTTSQTITGQKNFSGVVKFGGDTLSYFDANGTFISYHTTPYPVLRLYDSNLSDASYYLWKYEYVNPEDATRHNQVLRLGYNLAYGGGRIDNTKNAVGFEMESYWYPLVGKRWSEHHWVFISENGTLTRPLSMESDVADSGYIRMRMAGDVVNITNKDPNDIYLYLTANAKIIYNTGWYVYKNNVSALQQSDTSTVPNNVNLVKLDNSNIINIGQSTYPVNFLSNVTIHKTINDTLGLTADESMPGDLATPFNVVNTANDAGSGSAINFARWGTTAPISLGRLAMTMDIPDNRGRFQLKLKDGTGSNERDILEANYEGFLIFPEANSTNGFLTANTKAGMFFLNDKFYIAYNDSGLMKYKYTDLNSPNSFWTYTETIPKYNYGIDSCVNYGGEGQTDWDDWNSDGLADSVLQVANVNTTASIITGNGFAGNAQRFESDGTSTQIGLILLSIDNTKRYLLKLKYRSNCNFTDGTGNWVVEGTGYDYLPTNIDSAKYAIIVQDAGASDLQLFSSTIGTDLFIEIDEVSLKEITSEYTDGTWAVIYKNDKGELIDLGLGSSGTVLKSNGTTSAPSWQSDATGAGGSAYSDSVTINGRHVPGDSLMTIDDLDATYQPLDADLTDLADGILTASKVAGVRDFDYGDITVSSGAWAVKDDSHNHVISNVDGLQTALDAKQDAVSSFDTLAFSFNIPDTINSGDNAIWKIPNNITIVEVSAFTNTGTVTFNIEERGETTPNTAGTDVMTSDLVADTDQQETTTFSNSTLDKNDWVALVVASKTGDPTLFGVTIYYVKTN